MAEYVGGATPPLEDTNCWVDFWFYDHGRNIIPADTRKKKVVVEWKQYQTKRIPEEQIAAWKNDNAFRDGMAILPGITYEGEHKGEHFVFIDCDNALAVKEFLKYFAGRDGRAHATLEEIAEKFIVERHLDDLSKCHIYFYSELMFPKKSSDVKAVSGDKDAEIPAFEVKGSGLHGIAYCTPSFHKNGHRYKIIGTTNPVKLSEDQAQNLLNHLDDVCRKYGLHYLEYDAGDGDSKIPISKLYEHGFKILQGNNRHEGLLRYIDSIIKRMYGLWSLEKLRKEAYERNQELCDPPLDDNEFDKLFKQGTEFISKSVQQEQEQEQDQKQQQQQQQKEEKTAELTEDLIKEVDWDYIADILSTSIKKDRAAKLITFAGMLLAQTNKDQLNIGFQAESSAGKSYIPMELANYFPQDEIMKVASASPTAFYHKGGKWDDKRKALIVDLEHKIIIFMDMPGFQLMERLRPMASHDDKELTYLITENKKQGGLRTKTVILRGYPSIIFASAKQSMDEQEKTRLIQLSPAVDQEKLRESLELSTLRNANPAEYHSKMLENPKRVWLVNRISSLRHCTIREIVIPDNGKAVFDRFIKDHEHLKPRHQRDLPRVFAFIKTHALLNAFTREKLSNDTILANATDIEAGFALYHEIETSTELGLSPYLYGIYIDVIKPLLDQDGLGLGVGRDKIIRKFYQVRHKPMSPQVLKQEILPSLEAVGLIQQAPDKQDKRKMLVFDATKASERDDETIF